MKKLVTLALALVLALTTLCLVACGNSSPEGTYKFESVSMTAAGTTVTYTVGQTAPWGDDVLSADSNVIELKSDGTCVSSAAVAGQTMTQNGTWSLDGETLTITIEGEAQQATLKDGKITLTQSMAGTTLSYVLAKD